GSIVVFFLGFVVLSPAVLSAIFASDYSHHTISALLTFDRPRLQVLIPRLTLAVLLLYAPLVSLNWNEIKFTLAIIAVSCQIGVAPICSSSLKRPLLVWTAIIV